MTRNLLLLAMFAAAPLTFTACAGDDDGTTPTDDGGGDTDDGGGDTDGGDTDA